MQQQNGYPESSIRHHMRVGKHKEKTQRVKGEGDSLSVLSKEYKALGLSEQHLSKVLERSLSFASCE